MKIKIAILSVVVGFTVLGCKEYFDLNDNPNLVQDPPINAMLTTATQKAALNMQRFGNITAYYTQYLASPTASGAADTYQTTDNSTEWNQVYYAMADLHDMQLKAQELGAYQHLGAAKLLMAYQLGLVADTWGSAPYTQAFWTDDIITPAYDTEEELYAASLRLINESIVDLQRTDNTALLDEVSDLMHHGNVDAWVKTAYGIKARFLNKISKKATYDPNVVLAAIDSSYISNNDESAMNTFLGINPWAQIAKNNASNLLGGWLSDNLINQLNGTSYGVEDPRVSKMTDATINNDYVGTRNGQGNVGGANTVHDECYISLNCVATHDTSSLVIITYPEIKFIEAEAAFRAGDRSRAYAAYREGIQAHMTKLTVPSAQQQVYLNHPAVSVGASQLSLDLIFKEKYLVTYLNPEAWNDMRRHDYQYKDFKMPLNAYLTNFIRHVAYPADERGRNSSNVPDDGSLDSPVWWDRP